MAHEVLPDEGIYNRVAVGPDVSEPLFGFGQIHVGAVVDPGLCKDVTGVWNAVHLNGDRERRC